MDDIAPELLRDAARRRRAPRAARVARPLRAADRPAALGRRRARRARARRVAAAPALRRRRPGGRRGARPRIADALRNARLLRDRAEIAHVLSAGLRPDASPVLPGCEVAAVYQPAGEDVQAGGDFYDVIDAPSGSIVVMGDVVGKGAPAAALSAVVARDAADRGAASRATRARRWTSSTTRSAGAGDEPLHRRRDRAPVRAARAGRGAARRAPAAAARARRRRVPLGSHGPMLGAVEVAEWRPATVELAPERRARALHRRRARQRAARRRALRRGAAARARRALGRRRRRARLRARGRAGGAAAARRRRAAGDPLPRPARRCSRAARSTTTPSRCSSSRCPAGRRAPERGAARAAEALGGPARRRALEDDALIVVSELVTNAIRHGGARTRADEVAVHAALLRRGAAHRGHRSRPRASSPAATARGPTAATGCTCSTASRRAGASPARDPVTVWVELDALTRADAVEQVRDDPRGRAPDHVAADLVGVRAERHPAAHEPPPAVAGAHVARAAARAPGRPRRSCEHPGEARLDQPDERIDRVVRDERRRRLQRADAARRRPAAARSPRAPRAARSRTGRRRSSSRRPPGNEISPAWRRRSARRSVKTACSAPPASRKSGTSTRGVACAPGTASATRLGGVEQDAAQRGRDLGARRVRPARPARRRRPRPRASGGRGTWRRSPAAARPAPRTGAPGIFITSLNCVGQPRSAGVYSQSTVEPGDVPALALGVHLHRDRRARGQRGGEQLLRARARRRRRRGPSARRP